MPYDAGKELLPELLQCCRTIRLHQAAHIAILRSPRDWLAQNLEAAILPLLDSADHIDFDVFVQLSWKFDRGLARNIAQLALTNPDAHIREFGADCLAKLDALIT